MEVNNHIQQTSPQQILETNQTSTNSTNSSKILLIVLLVLGIIILIIIGGDYLLANKLSSQQQQLPSIQTQNLQINQPSPQIIFSEGQEVIIKGKVIQNNAETGIVVSDLPAKLILQTINGQITVEYNPGEAECKNTTPARIGYGLTIGERIEVFGKFNQGIIRTCGSEYYYIHKEFCGDNVCQEVVCAAIDCPKPETQQNCPQDCQTSGYKFQAISELKKSNPTSGIYKTEGYVVKKYTCPICPQGAVCKACMRDNILISEKSKTLETYSLNEKNLIIYTNIPNQFTLNQKYTFTIKILDFKSTGDTINDVELVDFK